MTHSLPVPIAFRLPNDAWSPEAPAAHGVSNAAFIALRGGLPDSYRPSLVVSGDVRTDGAGAAAIADEAMARLSVETGSPVTLVERSVVDSDHAPGVAQRLAVRLTADGAEHDVVQLQVVNVYVDLADAERRAVVIHTLSCLSAQLDLVEPEFAEYLRSVRLEDLPAG